MAGRNTDVIVDEEEPRKLDGSLTAQNSGPQKIIEPETTPKTWRFAQIVEEFAEETAIVGPSFLLTKLSRIEWAFWIFCTLFFSCCTAHGIADVTLAFLRQDTLSLTSEITNSTIVLDPSPTFVFTHGLGAFNFSSLSPDVEQLDSMVDDFLAVFKNVSLDEDVPLEIMQNQDLFEVLATMMHKVVSNELSILLPSQISPNVWASQYQNRPNFSLLQSAVERVYNFIRERKIDFSKLLKYIATQICLKAEFAVEIKKHFEGTTTSSPCLPKNMFGLGVNFHTKFKLNNPLSFSYQDDYALISWKGHETQQVSVDLSGTPQMIWERENTFLRASYSHGGERVVVGTQISAMFLRVEDKASLPCSKAFSRYDCKQRAYINAFVEQCHCYPLFFATVYASAGNVKMCPYNEKQSVIKPPSSDAVIFDYLSNCSRINASEEQRRARLFDDLCPPDCRTQTFATTVERETSPIAASSRCELKLSIQSFTFQLVEEKLAMTFGDFVSQFGGVLGLYIGISFAGLVHIPVFVLRKIVEKCSRKTKEQVRTQFVEMANSSQMGRLKADASSEYIATVLENVLQRINLVEQQLSEMRHDFSGC